MEAGAQQVPITEERSVYPAPLDLEHGPRPSPWYRPRSGREAQPTQASGAATDFAGDRLGRRCPRRGPRRRGKRTRCRPIRSPQCGETACRGPRACQGEGTAGGRLLAPVRCRTGCRDGPDLCGRARVPGRLGRRQRRYRLRAVSRPLELRSRLVALICYRIEGATEDLHFSGRSVSFSELLAHFAKAPQAGFPLRYQPYPKLCNGGSHKGGGNALLAKRRSRTERGQASYQ